MKKLVFLFAMVFAVSMAMGQDNDADITQYGKNTAEIDQIGSENVATVEQGEEGREVTNFDTDSWRYGAFIEQVGNENEAVIKMWKGDGTYQSGGSSNGARIEQDGDENTALQDISNSQVKTSNWDRMGAHIKQLGDENFAQQEVFRSFGTNGSGGILIDQDGDANQARQYVIGGRSNVTEVFQEGNNNTYTGFQSSIADVLDLDWQFVPAGEEYTQFQRGESSEVKLNVVGNDNITAQYQEGDVWGRAYNIANIDIDGDFNEAAQAQLGTYNEADISVNGDYNEAGTQQVGDYNEAEILQMGDSNLGTITSTGDYHTGDISQFGNGNEALITQSQLP